MITLHISIILREALDQLPQSQPRRLPCRVRGCVVDPHPPSGIARAALSNVTIHMKSPRYCTPWNLFLTRLWLRDILNTPLLEHDEDNTNLKEDTYIVSLRPFRPSSSLPVPYRNSKAIIEHTEYPVAQKQYLQTSNSFTGDIIRLSPEPCHDTKELLSYAIQSFFSGASWPHKGEIDKTILDNGSKISEITPVLFKSGYYEVSSL